MKLGSNDISAVKIGSTDVNKIYIGSTEVWTSFTGLLDTYTGAAAAYSLRLLRTAYTGDAIEVRRASDNATQDIGFVNNELDVTSLESFCSGTNGFVTTWYDQSGNGNDATQSTASAQPQIVSSGSVILENGKPVLQALSNGFLSIALAVENIRLYGFYVFNYISSQNSVLFSSGNDYAGLVIPGNTGSILARATNNNFYKNSTSISPIYNRDEMYNAFINQGLLTWDITTNSGQWVDDFEIGYGSGYYSPNIQEIIIYNSDQSLNRTGIETNINDFYSIY